MRQRSQLSVVIGVALTVRAGSALAGPSYPLSVHVECADSIAEARLVFPPAQGSGREDQIRAAERSARLEWIEGAAGDPAKVAWDQGFGELNAWRWKEARRRGHVRILLFLRAGPHGASRSLVLGVTGVPNDIHPAYESKRAEIKRLWQTRKGDRTLEGCIP